MKHILVISQYFHPETFRINDLAEEWVNRGYKVTVLTGIPNYPYGSFYSGYSWFKRRHQKWKGIDIIRIPIIPRWKSSLGMILNYISFVLSGWIWNRYTKIQADLVFSFEVSPMTQVLVGCDYAKKHKVKHFIYVQDLWPENVETVTGIHNSVFIGLIDRMVDKIYKQADQIFVTSPSFVQAVVKRKNEVSVRKVHYWPQYAEDFYKPMKKCLVEGIGENDKSFKIAFTGNIGTAQGLEILPKTAKLLKNENVKFVIVGDGRYKAQFVKMIKELKVQEKFIILHQVNAERIPEILSVCNAGFISFNKATLWEKTIPAKLQSYMACGKAVLAAASGETKRVINEAKCGVCVEIGNYHDLANGIKAMMKMDCNEMGKRARLYAQNRFDKKKLMDEMSKWINK